MFRLNASITQSRHGHMLALAVDVIAVRVGVAGGVEPGHRHPLAVVRRVQQAIDALLVGVGRLVGEERVDLGRRRRQAGQVEVTRRSSVALSASGDGFRPFASSRARMNRSIGLRTHAGWLTAGSSARFGATYAQCVSHLAPFVDPAAQQLDLACPSARARSPAAACARPDRDS